ncbi:MAG: hypothetical protein AAF745_08820, partial [Planctomycetota bacterium]
MLQILRLFLSRLVAQASRQCALASNVVVVVFAIGVFAIGTTGELISGSAAADEWSTPIVDSTSTPRSKLGITATQRDWETETGRLNRPVLELLPSPTAPESSDGSGTERNVDATKAAEAEQETEPSPPPKLVTPAEASLSAIHQSWQSGPLAETSSPNALVLKSSPQTELLPNPNNAAPHATEPLFQVPRFDTSGPTSSSSIVDATRSGITSPAARLPKAMPPGHLPGWMQPLANKASNRNPTAKQFESRSTQESSSASNWVPRGSTFSAVDIWRVPPSIGASGFNGDQPRQAVISEPAIGSGLADKPSQPSSSSELVDTKSDVPSTTKDVIESKTTLPGPDRTSVEPETVWREPLPIHVLPTLPESKSQASDDGVETIKNDNAVSELASEPSRRYQDLGQQETDQQRIDQQETGQQENDQRETETQISKRRSGPSEPLTRSTARPEMVRRSVRDLFSDEPLEIDDGRDDVEPDADAKATGSESSNLDTPSSDVRNGESDASGTQLKVLRIRKPDEMRSEESVDVYYDKEPSLEALPADDVKLKRWDPNSSSSTNTDATDSASVDVDDDKRDS